LLSDYKKYIVFFVPAIFFLRIMHTYEKLFLRHSNHQIIGVNSVVIGLFFLNIPG